MVDVLTANTPIVDESYRPTREFMVKWSQLASTLLTIPVLSTAAQVSAVVDVLGSTFGEMLVRGSTQWGPLAPGTLGQVLSYQAGGPTWSAAPAVANLSDVLLSAPANNDVLTYVTAAGKWENKPASGGGGGGGWYLTPPVYTALSAFRNLGGSFAVQQRTAGAVPSMAVQSGGSDGIMYCAMRAAPGGSFSMVVKIHCTWYPTTGGWRGGGIACYSSTTGKFESMFINGNRELYTVDWANTTSYTLNSGSQVADTEWFLHMDYDSGVDHLSMSLSKNGIDKFLIRYITVSTFMTAITHVGPCWHSDSQVIYTFDHFWVGALGTSGILP
jgi:hypothetical protein